MKKLRSLWIATLVNATIVAEAITEEYHAQNVSHQKTNDLCKAQQLIAAPLQGLSAVVCFKNYKPNTFKHPLILLVLKS